MYYNSHVFVQLYKHLLFISALLHELVKSERISGYTLGGRQDSSVFYPSTYTRAQQKWMDDFYTQNGYLGKLHSTNMHFSSTLFVTRLIWQEHFILDTSKHHYLKSIMSSKLRVARFTSSL